jgi:UDPglucose 6-dehydrogenase
MRECIPDIEYADTPQQVLDASADALVVTDWPEITILNEEFDAMVTPVVVDGRRDRIVYEGLT